MRPASAQAEAPILAKETAESFSYMLDAGGESSGKPEGLVADESSTASVADSEEIPPRAWSYLTLTSDGEDLRLYVNGKQWQPLPPKAPSPVKGTSRSEATKSSATTSTA